MHFGWGGDLSLVSGLCSFVEEGAEMVIGQFNEALRPPMKIEAILAPDFCPFVLCG